MNAIKKSATSGPSNSVTGLFKLAACAGLIALQPSTPLRADTPVVTGQTLSTYPPRNDWSEPVGFRFTTGSLPLVVSQLGRWVVSGNTQSHTVEIVDAETNSAVCTASIATNLAPAGFKYANLSGGPYILAANHVYYLLSSETSGGDSWYQADTSLTTTNDITINNEEYQKDSKFYSSNDFTTTNHSYGPVSFMYSLAPSSTVASPTTEAITGAALGKARTDDGPYDVGFMFSPGNNQLTVTQLGRLAKGNGNSHVVKLFDVTNTTTAMATATVSTSTTPTNQFTYATVSAVTLYPGHSYYLVSHETGNDPFYEDNTAIIPTSDVTITGPAFSDSTGAFFTPVDNGSTNHGYGLPSFCYNTQTVEAPSSLDTARNNYPDYVGFKFTTGNVPLVISYLGRLSLSGHTSTQTHPMKIVDDATGGVVCTASVDASAVAAGDFAYAPLASSVTLQPSHSYYIMSEEYSSGDFWTDEHTSIAPTSDITIVGAEFEGSGAYATAYYGNYSYGPVTFLYAQARPSFHLETSDTLLTLNVFGAPFITQLASANTKGWDWGATPSVVPLPRYVYAGSGISGTPYIPNWTFYTSDVNTSSGTKVTLTYKSDIAGGTQNLILTQIWRAFPGVGPVQEATTVTNSTGGHLTYADSDLIPADFTATSDADPTLWRFIRGINQNDSNLYDGPIMTTLTSASSPINSTVSNTIANGPYVLPFAMLDVPGSHHGMYFGYYRPFGKYTFDNTVWAGSPDKIRCSFSVWDTTNGQYFDQDNSTTTELPSMFLGAYVGDTDDGSNLMKHWFWNNLITPTIISTTNEPLVTVATALDTYSESTNFFSVYPSLASWGVELIKEDYQWTDDWDDSSHGLVGWDWDPAPTQWPSGIFQAPYLAHSNGLQFDLYMANTYKNADLSTSADIASEEGALLSRFDGTDTSFNEGFEYWRTDIRYEPDIDGSTTNVYGHHLGFLAVMDYMISSRSSAGFRWENTSTSSKKSFDFLERQSFGQICDWDIHLNYGLEDFRIIYYNNSYMMNPAQMDDQNDYYPSDSTVATVAEATYDCRTGYLGAWMHFLGNSVHDEVYQAAIGDYKSYQRPILRGANVYHILPNITSSYSGWDGIEFFNPGLGTIGKGSVLLFKKKDSSTNSPVIYLKGLVPSTVYTLSFQDRTGHSFSATGSQLMTATGTGIPSISGSAGEYDSEIIWINR